MFCTLASLTGTTKMSGVRGGEELLSVEQQCKIRNGLPLEDIFLVPK